MKFPRLVLALLAAIFLAAWVMPSVTRTLVRPDEGRYAEIAREMAASGDFVTPRLNDLKYFEKPPLQYWATALAIKGFGLNDFTARAWPLVAGVFGLLLTWLAGRALASPKVAWVAASALGAMCYYFFIAHINTLDMGLTAFMTLTLVGMLRGFGIEGQSSATTRRWMLAAWAGAALAFLSKGLIGIVLPGAIFVLYLLISRQWSLLRRLEWWRGPLVFSLIALPWPLLVQSRNPEWANFFFIYEHFERFASEEHDRPGALLYFVPLVIIGLMPWTPALLKLLNRRSWLSAGSTCARATLNVPLFLALWCLFIFTFFSLSKSKLPSYLLPITPAAALLLAPILIESSPRAFRRLLLLFASVPALLLFAPLARSSFVNDVYTRGMVEHFALYLIVAGGVFAGAIATAWRLEGCGRRLDALIATAVLATLGGSIAASGYETLAASTSSKQLVHDFRSVEPDYRDADPFFSVGLFEQTLQPYLGRSTTLVDFLDELGLGAAAEPDKVRFNFADFADEWNALDRAYAITDFDQLPRFDLAGLDYRVVAVDLRRVIIARHGPR